MSTTTKNHRRSLSAKNHRIEEMREQAIAVGQGVRAIAATAGAAAADQLSPLEAYVKEKPVKSLLIAAGVGALLGFVFLRR